MTHISDNQVEKLLGDIASIKSVLSENKALLRHLLLPVHFRLISLISGLAIIGLSLLFYYLLNRHGSYDAIPGYLRNIAIGLIVVSWISVALLKRILWVKSVNRFNSGYTFGMIIRRLYSYQLFHIWIPILALMFFFIGVFILFEQERYIISAISLASGIIYNTIGSTARIWQYLICGYWLIIVGILPVVFPGVSALIFLALSLGVGMLLFYVFSGRESTLAKED